MPMGMATDIVYSAALKHCEKFANSSGVECRLADLKHPERPVNFLKRPQSQPLSSQVPGLRGTFFDQPLRCKTIELPLNYHKTMVRYAFQIPSKKDDQGKKKCKRYFLR